MSAIHTGSVAARLRKDGLLEYTGTSHDHAVTGWPEPTTPQIFIPKQRAGGTYGSVVLVSRRGPAMVSTCCECGHSSGCDCDCCPITLPAVAIAVATGGTQ